MGIRRSRSTPHNLIENLSQFADPYDFVEELVIEDEKQQIAKAILFTVSSKDLNYLKVRYLTPSGKRRTFRECSLILRKSVGLLHKKDRQLRSHLKEAYLKIKQKGEQN